MRIIARSTLGRSIDTFKGQKDQGAVRAALNAWFCEAERADWGSSADVKKSYASASIVDGERVVFNIEGNHYRLVTAVDYALRTVFIKWLGPHAAYDRIDVRTVQYGDQTYQKR